MCEGIDKRIEKTRIKAWEAALDVVADGGFAALTIEAVAERSGIAKSTLYRHWPGRVALLTDALETLNRQPGQVEPVQSGQVRARIVELVTHLAGVFEGSRVARVMPALIEAAEHHPDIAAFLHGYSAARRRTLVEVVRRGIELGELRPDLDAELAAVMISGPIFYYALMSPAPFPSAKAPELVDLALSGAAA